MIFFIFRVSLTSLTATIQIPYSLRVVESVNLFFAVLVPLQFNYDYVALP